MSGEFSGKNYTGYDYKRVIVKEEQVSFFLDSYENFGWFGEENIISAKERGQSLIQLKRHRKISNKMELTRLERNFEACVKEMEALEHSKTTMPTILALVIGLFGTAFIVGSVFAVTAETPVIWLCVLLAIPGFCGWILPYFIYRYGVSMRTRKIEPFLELKYDEIYEICKKGHNLL